MKQYVLSKKSRGYRGGPPPAYDFNNKPLLFDNLKDAIIALKEMNARNPVGYDIFVYMPEFQKKYLKPIKIKETVTTEQKLRKIIREELIKEISSSGKVYNQLNEEIAEIKRKFLIEWRGIDDAQEGPRWQLHDRAYKAFDQLISALGYLSQKI